MVLQNKETWGTEKTPREKATGRTEPAISQERMMLRAVSEWSHQHQSAPCYKREWWKIW